MHSLHSWVLLSTSRNEISRYGYHDLQMRSRLLLSCRQQITEAEPVCSRLLLPGWLSCSDRLSSWHLPEQRLAVCMRSLSSWLLLRRSRGPTRRDRSDYLPERIRLCCWCCFCSSLLTWLLDARNWARDLLYLSNRIILLNYWANTANWSLQCRLLLPYDKHQCDTDVGFSRRHLSRSVLLPTRLGQADPMRRRLLLHRHGKVSHGCNQRLRGRLLVLPRFQHQQTD